MKMNEMTRNMDDERDEFPYDFKHFSPERDGWTDGETESLIEVLCEMDNITNKPKLK